jgi:lambda repressor-like predicted transcriptional regulator
MDLTDCKRYITRNGYIFCEADMAKVEDQNEWAVKAKNLLKAELKRKGVSYRNLSVKLTEMGSGMSEQALANKISRGGFSAAFLLQCLSAIGAESISL